MRRIIEKTASLSAIIGGVVLTMLALMVTTSVIGGAIATLAHSNWLDAQFPALAQLLQTSGIRTIPGMFEIMQMGIAFVIFSFFPIAQLQRAHAVVDIFVTRLPVRLRQALVTLWEVLFFIVLVVITWRLFHGMMRMESSSIIYQDLGIPQWWGYGVAFLQMIIASLTGVLTASDEVLKLFDDKDIDKDISADRRGAAS